MPPPRKRPCIKPDTRPTRDAIVQEFGLDPGQTRAFVDFAGGTSGYLYGLAGTGKSKVISALRAFFKRTEPPTTHSQAAESFVLLAPTGVAAYNINGRTIHSWLGLSPDDAKKPVAEVFKTHILPRKAILWRMRRTRAIIIDEISMVAPHLITLLAGLMGLAHNEDNPVPFGRAQVVMIGDFFQLKPIPDACDAPHRYAFTTDAWKRRITAVYELTQIHRQCDPAFIDVLKDVRVGHTDTERVRAFVAAHLQAKDTPQWSAVRRTNLFSHNADVHRTNELMMARLGGTAHSYPTVLEGNEQQKARLKPLLGVKMAKINEPLMLRVGARVMLTVNLDTQLGMVNGATGEVMSFVDGLPNVQFTCGVTCVVRVHTLSSEGEDDKVPEGGVPRAREVATMRGMPLRLAWAVTFHSCQGLTVDGPVLINLSRSFESGMPYVALTRVRDPAQVTLDGDGIPKLQPDPEVVAFYEALRPVAY